MKITEQKLKEIIKEELLKEFTPLAATTTKGKKGAPSIGKNIKAFGGGVKGSSLGKTGKKNKTDLEDEDWHFDNVPTKVSKKKSSGVRENKKNVKKEDFGSPGKQLQGFSSKEAKKVVDDGLRDWAKDIRKVEGRVIKDWMKAAKSGVMDYFDLVRGLETGDIARAHPYETKFFKAMLDRDKIMNRFRQYFSGKKGMGGRK